MLSKLRRLDTTDVIAWLIVGGIVVAIGAGMVRGAIDLYVAAVDDPLLVTGCIAVAVAVYLLLSAARRAVGNTWEKHTSTAYEVVPAAPLPAGLAPRRPDLGAARRLLDELTPLDGDAARFGLRRLSDDRLVLDGLFHHARRGSLTEQLRIFTAAAVVPGAPPLACALASVDRNGYVRERAVRAMGRRPVPEFVPFLVERAVDVVEPVRVAALDVLRDLVATKPRACRAALLLSGKRVERRDHAASVLALIATVTEPR
ncbi:hypothetical protein Ait01nite_027330 [Actinoplanes italicus]|uniref:HEAT repeat protein n=1 Tax=Actinoplanes italicus TaxID=113567 RepID=A0A2T0KEY8_9ACTN|nr:hypothetical protein [Actinoplanes italicus]PRX21895.1 hypothetical protein CLV67_10572 [Actinoplanes italicus]GIE29688.1 hypothetical protein Ait01nite_027330 [Actinoplanes italicus]